MQHKFIERRQEMDNLKFKAWLVENKIQQAEVAEILKITPENVNAKLNGRLPFTFEQVQTLCRHYKISADDYLTCCKCETEGDTKWL